MFDSTWLIVVEASRTYGAYSTAFELVPLLAVFFFNKRHCEGSSSVL